MKKSIRQLEFDRKRKAPKKDYGLQAAKVFVWVCLAALGVVLMLYFVQTYG